MSDSSGRLGTIAAIAGLFASLVGNYLQFKKTASDEQVAQQQIMIAQQQATTAREELSLKQKEISNQQDIQSRSVKNCDQLLAERDDALKAVHLYDNSITNHQAKLEIEKQQLALAEAGHDSFHINEHRSLADMEENAVKSLTDSRDEAAARVRDIERNCK